MENSLGKSAEFHSSDALLNTLFNARITLNLHLILKIAFDHTYGCATLIIKLETNWKYLEPSKQKSLSD